VEFLIELAKEVFGFFVFCACLSIGYLAYIIVREIGWEIKRQNREKKDQKTE